MSYSDIHLEVQFKFILQINCHVPLAYKNNKIKDDFLQLSGPLDK